MSALYVSTGAHIEPDTLISAYVAPSGSVVVRFGKPADPADLTLFFRDEGTWERFKREVNGLLP